MKATSSLFNRLTSRYLVIIHNKDNFAKKASFSVSYAKVIVLAASVTLLLFVASFFLSRTWLEWHRSADEQARRQRVTRLAVAVDSLVGEIETRDRFIHRFQTVLNEELPPLADMHPPDGSDPSDEEVMPHEGIDLQAISTAEQQLRSEFESARPASAGEAVRRFGPALARPLEGIITADYNTDIAHYGVDIVAKENESVRAIADGTVLLATWTEDTGYVLAIQHANSLVSVYKHNASLTKKMGEPVVAGEVIAIVGNTGELTTGPHLHFETWYDGQPVDPKTFLSLQ